MKKIITVSIMLAFVAMASAQNSKTIAVATFDVTANAVTKDEADSITELFINELASSKKLIITDRNNFDKIIKEMKFQNTDWSDKNKTAALGKASNAGLIARGSITKLGSKYTIASTIIDVNTANVKSSARKQFNNIDEIFDILTEYCKDLVAGLTYRIGDTGPGGGIVFNIEGTKFYEVSENLGCVQYVEARDLCKNYKGGGFSDWRLPNAEEARKIIKNTSLCNDGWWWCSSAAFYERFGDIDTSPITFSSSKENVRAVRVFEE